MDSIIVDNDMDLDHYLWFTNAIRSSLTRQKYFGRLNSFFDFILIPVGALDERCKIFISKCNNAEERNRCFHDLQLSEANKTSLRN